MQKHIILLILSALFLFSCKQNQDKITPSENIIKAYPSYVQNVIEAHGGLSKWHTMKAIKYEIEKEGKNEEQFINLSDRREKIIAADFTMGYDGKNYWMEADTSVKTDPVFYKNLMFYFYAMPFVLADAGIVYESVDPLVFEDTSYPGFKVSYESGIGESPEDEYYVYYDQQTKQMAWLAYTVTYFSKEKSKKLGWIRYDNWQEIHGLTLPATMAWQTVADNRPIGERNRRTFANVMLSKNAFPDDMFKPTENAKIFN